MTEEKVVEQIERTIYVANDGTKFDSKAYCAQYELDCARAEAAEIAESLPQFVQNSPVGFETWRFAFCETVEQYEAFEADCLSSDCQYGWREGKPFPPHWVIAEYGDDGYGEMYEANVILNAFRDWILECQQSMIEKTLESKYKNGGPENG